MKVAHYPHKIDQKESTLVLGSFETIHNGHLALINAAKVVKKPIHLMVVKNAQTLPSGNSETKVYENLTIRLQKIANLGVAKVTVVNFDQNIRLLPGKEFVDEMVKISNAKIIVIGEDFACGQNRDYTAKEIANDYQAIVVRHQKINNQKISTTSLKEMVQAGEMALIKKVAPFPFSLMTKVDGKNHFQINDLAPHPGIYVISAIFNDIKYWGYAHIGFKEPNTLHLNSFLLKNTPYETTISFHKLSRIITSNLNDEVTEEDKKRINDYFQAR